MSFLFYGPCIDYGLLPILTFVSEATECYEKLEEAKRRILELETAISKAAVMLGEHSWLDGRPAVTGDPSQALAFLQGSQWKRWEP